MNFVIKTCLEYKMFVVNRKGEREPVHFDTITMQQINSYIMLTYL